ncbi:hypothetical protein [Natronomonas sp. EA1]
MPAKQTETTEYRAQVWHGWQSLDRGWKATIIGCVLLVIAAV